MTCLDDDDELLPHHIQVSLDALDRSTLPPPVGVVSGVVEVLPGGRIAGIRLPPTRLRGQHYALEPIEPGRSYAAKQSLLLPTEVLRSIGGWDEQLRSRVVTEMFLRLNRVCSLEGLDVVTYRLHRHAGDRVSLDPSLRQTSFRQLVDKHRELFEARPGPFADLLIDHALMSLRVGQPAARRGCACWRRATVAATSRPQKWGRGARGRRGCWTPLPQRTEGGGANEVEVHVMRGAAPRCGSGAEAGLEPADGELTLRNQGGPAPRQPSQHAGSKATHEHHHPTGAAPRRVRHLRSGRRRTRAAAAGHAGWRRRGHGHQPPPGPGPLRHRSGGRHGHLPRRGRLRRARHGAGVRRRPGRQRPGRRARRTDPAHHDGGAARRHRGRARRARPHDHLHHGRDDCGQPGRRGPAGRRLRHRTGPGPEPVGDRCCGRHRHRRHRRRQPAHRRRRPRRDRRRRHRDPGQRPSLPRRRSPAAPSPSPAASPSCSPRPAGSRTRPPPPWRTSASSTS